LAMAGGLLGKKLEDKFNRMSEYDKTNYITFPFCLNRLEKVFHWRIPQAEVNRLAGAIIWKTGMAIQGKLTKPEQVFDVGVGLLPTTITPIFEIVGAWFDYIRGINPYDSFYGRNVLDYQTEKIRGVEGLKQMSYWTLNKLGLGNFATYDLSEKTTTEKIIQFTPILSRAIRISDYGMTEIEREVEKVELKERAIEAKKEDDVIKKYVSEYLEKGGDREDYKQKTIDELFPEGVATKEEKSDAKRIEKDFDQMILKRKGDIRVRTIMKLQLNTSKIKTLNKYKEEMSEEEYDNLLDILLDNKVISKDVYKEVK